MPTDPLAAILSLPEVKRQVAAQLRTCATAVHEKLMKVADILDSGGDEDEAYALLDSAAEEFMKLATMEVKPHAAP